MFYYVLPMTGTGIYEDPLRPKVWPTTNFVGASDLKTGTFLVATPEPIPGRASLTEEELTEECWRREYNLSDIMTWWVPGGVRGQVEVYHPGHHR